MTQQSRYHPSLDGLRAVCILFTIANHTSGNPGINGTIGVDIFFALSGYLITMLLIREHEETGSNCLLCFYIRRFFRILPLYYLTILLYFPSVLISYYVTGDDKGLHDFMHAFPFLISFNSEWRTLDAGVLFGHAWTLGIEEKYYLLWPALFVFVGSGKRVLWLLPLMPFFFLLGDMSGRGYVGILAGSLGACLIEAKPAIETKSGAGILRLPIHLWFALMCLGYGIATAFDNTSLNILISIPAVFFIADLIHKPSVYQSILSVRPLAWLGTLTYGIYLIHRLVGHVYEELFAHLKFAPGFLTYFCLAYGSSVIVAYVLQRAIELPMIGFGKRLSKAYEASSMRLKGDRV